MGGRGVEGAGGGRREEERKCRVTLVKEGA